MGQPCRIGSSFEPYTADSSVTCHRLRPRSSSRPRPRPRMCIGHSPHELPFFELELEHEDEDEVRTMYPHVEVHENDIGFIQFHTRVSISKTIGTIQGPLFLSFPR